MSISSIGSATSALTYTQSNQRPKPPAMTDTAQLLGISTDQLSTDLQSGSTLSSLAGKAGISSSDLLSSVETDLKANAPQGAPALSDTQMAQMATNIINGTGPGGPGGPGGVDGPGGVSGPGGPGATSSTSGTNGTSAATTANLSDLASAAGMDPSELLSQLTSGQDLSQLLGSASQTGYGSTVADSVSGGLIVDQYA
jgi:hypothetical protein